MTALHDPSTCACCRPGAAPASGNPPGLASVRYRVGTYSTFLRTMLDGISSVSVPGTSLPLAGWTSRTSDDPGIALLQMWAYVLDVLTFYQERIANEAFLRTAVQPESVTWLAALIGYAPAPGVAAQTHATFTVEKGNQVAIPIGLRLQSVPGQDEQPQKFETVEAFTAYASLNTLALRTTMPAPIVAGMTEVFLQGTNLGVAPGDYLLFVGDERLNDATSEVWDLRRVSRVVVDSSHGTTRLGWDDGLGGGTHVPEPPTNARVQVFRGQSWPFGYNAPSYAFVSPEVKDALHEWTGASLASASATLDLAKVERGVRPTPSPPTSTDGAWVTLVSAGGGGFSPYVELYRVTKAIDTVRSDFLITSKVTRLALDTNVHLDLFPMQGTQVLASNEELTLGAQPITSPIGGTTLTIDGTYPDLGAGRKLLVLGQDVTAGAVSEIVIVASASIDTASGTTVVTLTAALAHDYLVSSVQIFGNVALATHGETVRDETLGDGDASTSGQEMIVSRSSVTFVRDGSKPHGARNTLEVRVTGVRWSEDTTLFDHGGGDPVFVTAVDTKGAMHVRFGDGEMGARLPTGRGNVVGTYRRGLGVAGNVAAGALATLLDKPTGLKSTVNPLAATGGADPELPTATRKNAPNGVRTLGRIVSLGDFEDAALEVSGVAYARAHWGWSAAEYEPQVRLTLLGAGGAALSADVLGTVGDYLNGRRDTNKRLRLELGSRVPIQIALRYWRDPDDLAPAVVRTILDRLAAWIGALELGEGLHASRAYEVLVGVPGLRASVVVSIARKSGVTPPGAVLVMQPNELAVLDDPFTDVTLTEVTVP